MSKMSCFLDGSTPASLHNFKAASYKAGSFFCAPSGLFDIPMTMALAMHNWSPTEVITQSGNRANQFCTLSPCTQYCGMRFLGPTRGFCPVLGEDLDFCPVLGEDLGF